MSTLPFLRIFLLIAAACCASSCDALFSSLPADDFTFDAPLEDLSEAQLNVFIAGDEAFGETFTRQTGLGPIFNQASCVTCHPGDGRGDPSTNLVRFGVGDASDSDQFDYLEALGGPQLQDHAIDGYVAERLPEQPGLRTSTRGGPIVAGMGMIAAIPIETIIENQDPNDVNGDGIRGTVNLIKPPAFAQIGADCACDTCVATSAGCRMVGRFGRKATAATLLQQTVAAYLNDMGITSEQLPDDVFNPLVGAGAGDNSPNPEVSASDVENVVFYLRTLRPPPRRNADSPTVVRGETVFSEIGCAACHIPTMQTRTSGTLEIFRNKAVNLYSDLLLHDLGPQLADGYPEESATGNQWRTTPLWGLGLVATQLGGRGVYMHDGRAKSIRQAIELHGGESQAATDAFNALDASARRDLLEFLDSL